MDRTRRSGCSGAIRSRWFQRWGPAADGRDTSSESAASRSTRAATSTPVKPTKGNGCRSSRRRSRDARIRISSDEPGQQSESFRRCGARRRARLGFRARARAGRRRVGAEHGAGAAIRSGSLLAEAAAERLGNGHDDRRRGRFPRSCVDRPPRQYALSSRDRCGSEAADGVVLPRGATCAGIRPGRQPGRTLGRSGRGL